MDRYCLADKIRAKLHGADCLKSGPGVLIASINGIYFIWPQYKCIYSSSYDGLQRLQARNLSRPVSYVLSNEPVTLALHRNY